MGRKENGYKRDREFMFDEPQKYEMEKKEENKNDDKKEENENDDDIKEEEKENDDNKAGGWKKAERAEIFDVANGIKDEVEQKAKEDGQDEFKIFEVVSGTKQVVAGMNYKIKIKVGDSRFIEVLVYRSLPPISYELKNVTY